MQLSHIIEFSLCKFRSKCVWIAPSMTELYQYLIEIWEKYMNWSDILPKLDVFQVSLQKII